MRSSCINHPPNESLIIVHPWQIKACDGDRCAATLLSFFEYWHNWALRKAEKNTQLNRVAQAHGEAETHDTTLLQWHTEKQLMEGVLGFFSKNIIARGLDVLYGKGFVTKEQNPRPRYQFDRTRYFLFHPKVVNKWLAEHYDSELNDPSPKSDSSSPISDSRSPKNGAPSPISGGYIENKITEEITSETTPEREGEAPAAPHALGDQSEDYGLTDIGSLNEPTKRLRAAIMEVCGLSEKSALQEKIDLASALARCIEFKVSIEDVHAFRDWWVKSHEKKPLPLLIKFFHADIGPWAQTVRPYHAASGSKSSGKKGGGKDKGSFLASIGVIQK